MNVELLILKNLLKNEEYVKAVLPYLKPEYFQQQGDKILFETVKDYILKYNSSPSLDTIEIEIDDRKGVAAETVKEIRKKLSELKQESEPNDLDWLKKRTEDFCKDQALYNAITKSISIIQDEKQKLSKGSIPQLLTEALAISFDPSIGHDFLEDAEERYEYYHRKEERIPLDLEFFNLITRKGLPKRTLTIVMAGPNVGKSLWMTHTAAHFLNIGKNVLYITMEMRQEEIAKRIDCNLLNITFDDLDALPKDLYLEKVSKLGKKTNGKLVIKEYANGSASDVHFRALLNELQLKKSFKPDAIFIDYMNICASSRKNSNNVKKHEYVLSISEEFRAMATDFDVPIVTATQVNRAGFKSSEADMGDVSEAFAVTGTADFMFYIQTNEQLEELGQLAITQLKNRLNTKAQNRKFVIGVNYNKMKLYDTEMTAQTLSNSKQEDDTPVFDRGKDKFKSLKVFDGE